MSGRITLESVAECTGIRKLGCKELITEFAPESIGAELVELEEVA